MTRWSELRQGGMVAWLVFGAFLLPVAGRVPLAAQGTDGASVTFESASVKPAPADASVSGLSFMIALGRQTPPHGLLTMTGPLAPFIVFAYSVQDEVEARAMRARLPEWAQRQKFTIVARAPQENPTTDQLRMMMRALLEDRFFMQAHQETRTATVNLLITAKPGSTGPGLKPHDAALACVQRGSPAATPQAGDPVPVLCGLDLSRKEGGLMHVTMVDVTLPEACTLFGGLAGVLGGRGMDRVVDNTGLTGRWDITLDFLPDQTDAAETAGDTGGPTFTGAFEKQLGLRLKKGTAQIEDLIVDRVAQPTPD